MHTCKEKLEQQFKYLFEEKLIEDMCRHGKLRVFDANVTIMDIGSDLNAIPFVIDGSIKVLTENDQSDDLLLYYLESGDTCSVTLSCCSHNAKSKVKAIAETRSEVLFIPGSLLSEWMVRYASWRNYILDSYNSRLNEMIEAIDSLAFQNLEERLMNYLKDKSWVNKTRILDVTHQQIASDLNSSRVVISRLLKKFEKNKMILQQRNRVELTDKLS